MLTKFFTVMGTFTLPGTFVALMTVPAVVTGAFSDRMTVVMKQKTISRKLVLNDLSPALPFKGRERWFQV
jgi:hypothetical protein